MHRMHRRCGPLLVGLLTACSPATPERGSRAATAPAPVTLSADLPPFPAGPSDPTASPLAFALGHTADISALGFSANGEKVASSSIDGRLKIWSTGDCGLIRSLDLRGAGATSPFVARRIVWSSDERFLVVSEEHSAFLLDASTGKRLAGAGWGQFSGEGQYHAVLSADGTTLATSENDRDLALYDTSTGQRRALLRNELPTYASFVEWPAGNVIVTIGGTDGDGAALRDGTTGKVRKTVPFFRRASPDPTGRRVAILSANEVHVLDAKTLGLEVGRALFARARWQSAQVSLAWSSDGTRLAVGVMGDGTTSVGAITILDVASRQKPLVVEANALRGAIAWRADGSIEDSQGQRWDASTGRALPTVAPTAPIGAPVRATSADGAQVAEVRNDPGAHHASVVLHDAANARPPRHCDASPAEIWEIAVGKHAEVAVATGEYLAAPSATVGATDGRSIGAFGHRVLRWVDGVVLASEPIQGNAFTVSYDPTGRYVVAFPQGEPHGDATLFTGAEPAGRILSMPGGWRSSHSWAADGSTLWLSSAETLRSFDTRSGQARSTQTMKHSILRVQASPRNDTLALALDDGVLRIQDIRSGRELLARPTCPGALGGFLLLNTTSTYAPDGSFALYDNCTSTLRRWSFAGGVVSEAPPVASCDDAIKNSLELSPDGQSVVGHPETRALTYCNALLARPRPVKLPQPAPGLGSGYAATFSPDGAHFATSAQRTDTAQVWGARRATLRGTLTPRDLPGMPVPSRRYGDVAWSQDGRVIAVWAHSVVRFWRLADGRNASLILLRKGPGFAWVAFDDEGHVDGDEEGLEVLRWREQGGERPLSGGELSQLRRPGLVQAVFATGL